MPFPPEFMRWVREQQNELLAQLDALEGGRMRLQKRRVGAPTNGSTRRPRRSPGSVSGSRTYSS
jgi:hypothetical protein